MLSRVERDVCQYFRQQELFQRFGRWVQWTNWAPDLADVVVLAGFLDRDDYRFVPYLSLIYVPYMVSVQLRLKMLVRLLMAPSASFLGGCSSRLARWLWKI